MGVKHFKRFICFLDFMFAQVYSSSLVDAERDYLSMDKRYPRLFVAPDCFKVCFFIFRLPLAFFHPFSFFDFEEK